MRWVDVELDATRPSLTINGTIKTETGKGTYRKGSPKSDASVRTVVLPGFAIAVLERRHATSPGGPERPGVPDTEWHLASVQQRGAPLATDPPGHRSRLGDPPTFRTIVATLISERVDAQTASQQLGHSSPAITREFYISKPAIVADVTHVLDELAAADPDA